MISYAITGLVGFAALWSIVKYFCPWLAYDIAFFGHMSKALSSIKAFSKMDPVFTVTSRLIDRAAGFPNKSFIIFEGESFSYKQINDKTNQIARVLHGIGVKPAEIIGILMTNSVHLVYCFFGISKVGASPSFMNYNLRGASLLHCIKVSGCSKLIISDEQHIVKALDDIQNELDELGITAYITTNNPKSGNLRYCRLSQMADSVSCEETPVEWRRHVTMSSHMCYIFTSGTTGLPKAAIVTHKRAWLAAKMFILPRVTPQDIVYTPLPMYHGSAALLGLLGVLETGSTMVLRKKFSASHFWDDCRTYNVTVVQYIGEILRYLCNQPECPNDKQHSVRLAFGNCLATEVWRTFLKRFGENITVAEFYSSTEGNIVYYNVGGIFGRVGQSSPLYNALCGVSFVEYDDTGDPIRNKNGRCIPAALGEPGLIIGKISTRSPFLGYRGDSGSTKRKILTDVFKPGDAYFDSGDIMLRHQDYTVSFVDRIGDTFRWKSENVSTYEVSDIMAKAPGISEANVFGVKIPGCEGRAGMVAVVLRPDVKTLDCKAVYEYATNTLAPFARPIFIRLQNLLELTSTWKQTKIKLMEEGFDLSKTGEDHLFVLDAKKCTYVPLTRDMENSIRNGTLQY